MLLQAGNTDVKFKERLVEGVENPNPSPTENLILDGQQRLTSLYQSLLSREARCHTGRPRPSPPALTAALATSRPASTSRP